jgi:hypothetical protein
MMADPSVEVAARAYADFAEHATQDGRRARGTLERLAPQRLAARIELPISDAG